MRSDGKGRRRGGVGVEVVLHTSKGAGHRRLIIRR